MERGSSGVTVLEERMSHKKPSNPPPGYPRISPYLNYENTGAMMEWLSRAFGLVERHALRQPDGSVSHAEMALEDAVVMMGSPGGGYRNPKHLGQSTQSLYVYIDDVDGHCARARAAGAEIVEEPADQPYGDRRYGAADPEGHRWYFACRISGPGTPN
jgi:PhnB protein